MSNKITLELNPNQVEELVDKLSIQDKLRLVRKLENATWANKLDSVVQRMRSRIKRVGISDREIERICEEVKKEYDEKHHRH